MKKPTDYTEHLVRNDVLSKLIQKYDYRRGAEIGVDSGRLTKMLLRTNPRLTLIAVDYWPEDYPDGPWLRGDGPSRGKDKQDFKKQKYLKRMARFGHRAMLIEKPSVEAAKQVPDGSLDFVFIDADHSYEGVKADIEAWLPKIRKGGYITGHDHSEKYFPGIVKAVAEAFGEVEILEDFIWAKRV